MDYKRDRSIKATPQLLGFQVGGAAMAVIDQRFFKVTPGNDGEHKRGKQACDGNTR
jgi:hypothetical protein